MGDEHPIPDEKLTGAERPKVARKPRYFEYTWVATCIASTLGAGYAVIVYAFVSPRPADVGVWVVFFISLMVAFPALFVGSALIGWWITKKLAERVRANRLLVFAMTGALMGIVADVIYVVLVVLDGHWWSDRPRGATEWFRAAMIGTIPVFTLMVAGLLTGLHAIMSEPAAAAPAPPRVDD
jgi:hypothetical protein